MCIYMHIYKNTFLLMELKGVLLSVTIFSSVTVTLFHLMLSEYVENTKSYL